jgi:hypothetical protein
MAGHSDSEIENSYSNEAEFEEKESGILLGLSNRGIRFCGLARAPLCVLFAVARKCHHGVFGSCYNTQMGSLAEMRGSLGQSIVDEIQARSFER